jgi:hypothetical protein
VTHSSRNVEGSRVIVVGLIFVSSVLHQVLHNCQVTLVSCNPEGSRAIDVGLVLVSPLLRQVLNRSQVTLKSCNEQRSRTTSVGLVLVSTMLHQELHYRQMTHLRCYSECSSVILLGGLIHISSCPNQILNFGQVTLSSCEMEGTFDDLPLSIHLAAIDFVSRPVVSLALCVAICCVPTSAAILHCGCTSLVTAIACARHVLRLDKYLTVEIRCKRNLLVNLQFNAKISRDFVGG